MAKKSKTQRAKASARRADRRVQQEIDAEKAAEAAKEAEAKAKEEAEAPRSKKLVKSIKSGVSNTASKAVGSMTQEKPANSAKEVKPQKKPVFFKEVRAELKRVTWPTKQDVLRWSGVVVVALVFFGLYTYLLDNFIVTPLLIALSSLGV